MLGRGALQSIGEVAALAASDRARTITAAAINITCCSVVGWCHGTEPGRTMRPAA
jgi:hypothetical protein